MSFIDAALDNDWCIINPDVHIALDSDQCVELIKNMTAVLDIDITLDHLDLFDCDQEYTFSRKREKINVIDFAELQSDIEELRMDINNFNDFLSSVIEQVRSFADDRKKDRFQSPICTVQTLFPSLQLISCTFRIYLSV